MKANTILAASILAVLLLIASSPQRDSFEKITVKEFELVDKSGKERATIKIEDSGEIVLRLRDSKGNVRVKVGASQDGSGLVLLNGDTNPGVHVLAKTAGSSISVYDAEGKKKDF